jgi:hypothetical protein
MTVRLRLISGSSHALSVFRRPPAAPGMTWIRGSVVGVAVWDDLTGALRQIRDQQPEALLGYPSLDSGRDRRPPFRIHLAPWAVDLAAGLRDRFGDDVTLQVGALRYPQAEPAHPGRAGLGLLDLPDLDPGDVEVSPGGPLTVRSGHTVRSRLLLRNLTGRLLSISTNGHLTAVVVDPDTGEIAGGFAGAQPLPLVWFRVEPGGTTPIPLLVGTASFLPRLGYAIPPARWAIRVPLDLGDGRRVRTPPLPITVTG